MRIAQIHRSDENIVGRHHAGHTGYQIVHILKTARLRAVPVNRNILAFQCLHDEIGHDPAVVHEHARSIRIENTDDFDAYPVLPMIIHKQRLRTTLAFVVTGTDADRIDIAPIALHLRMHGRITIHLARGCLQDFRLDPFGQAQHIDGPHDRSLDRLDRVILIMYRRGRTRQIVNLVHFGVIGGRDIVPHHLEIRPIHQVNDIGLPPCKIIVQTNDLMSLPEQMLTQMRTYKTGAARYQNTFHACSFLDDSIRSVYNPIPKYAKPAASASLRSYRLRPSKSTRVRIAPPTFRQSGERNSVHSVTKNNASASSTTS